MKSRSSNADPISGFAALEERIEKGALPRAIFILANSKGASEGFFAEQAIRVLKKRLESEKGVELFSHDPESEDFKLSVLCDDLQSQSLFGNAKALIVRRADSLCRKSSRDGKNPTPFESAVKHFVQADNSGKNGVLFCSFESISPESPLFQGQEWPGAVIFESRKLYSAPPPWAEEGARSITEAERWIEQRARKKKRVLSVGQRQEIFSRCAADLAAIENELEKLSLLGEPGSAPALPSAPTQALSESSPKKVIDAVFSRDLQQALLALESLFRNGFTDWNGSRVAPQAVFSILAAMWVQELRNLLQLKERIEAGESASDAMNALKIRGFAQASTLRKLKNFSQIELRRMYKELLQMERLVKQGRAPSPQFAVERFVLFACKKKEEVHS